MAKVDYLPERQSPVGQIRQRILSKHGQCYSCTCTQYTMSSASYTPVMNIIITSDTEKVLVPSTLRYIVAMEWSNSMLTTQVPNLGCLHTCRLLTSMITGQVEYVLHCTGTYVNSRTCTRAAPRPWYLVRDSEFRCWPAGQVCARNPALLRYAHIRSQHAQKINYGFVLETRSYNSTLSGTNHV